MDEVCDSNGCPTLQVKPILSRAIVLPLEGKGDRSAVDEVNIRPAPLRGAPPSKRKKRPIVEASFQLSGAFLLPIAYCLLPSLTVSSLSGFTVTAKITAVKINAIPKICSALKRS